MVTFFLLKDTPQSCGLPPIEEYKHEPVAAEVSDENKTTFKEIFYKYILHNKYLWYLAIANIFVYFIRYGVVSWAPTYLTAVKGFTKEGSRWAYFLYEWAGIPGMLVSGYLSDRVFRGRRAPATICFMLFVVLAILVYWFNPAGNILIDNLALIAIGFPHLRSCYDDRPSSSRHGTACSNRWRYWSYRPSWLPHRFRWCWCLHGSHG